LASISLAEFLDLLKVGAVSSIVSGFIGMKIATYANARTTLEARKGIAAAFAVGEAPRSQC